MTALSADAIHASNNQPTFIDILLDETGSMGSCHASTVDGFNKFVGEQREVPGRCYLTLTKFDTQGLRTPYEYLSIDMVPDLTFYPGASTNLFDVVGKRVSALLASPPPGRALVVVITDGEENASREFRTPEQVREVVNRALEAGITFLYFGAGHRARQTAEQMGFPASVINEFDTKRMAQTMNKISAQTTAFRANV
jgi:hypothetical protein